MNITEITSVKKQINGRLRLAPYCRVSSDSADQLHSFAAQIRYYSEYAKNHPEYELADIYHSDNIDRVSDDFIEEAQISTGLFDNVGECKYSIPSYWDIGKVYKRLIKQVAEYEDIAIIDALIKVYHSFISAKIDDYNSSVYYENPSYIFESYKENRML